MAARGGGSRASAGDGAGALGSGCGAGDFGQLLKQGLCVPRHVRVLLRVLIRALLHQVEVGVVALRRPPGRWVRRGGRHCHSVRCRRRRAALLARRVRQGPQRDAGHRQEGKRVCVVPDLLAGGGEDLEQDLEQGGHNPQRGCALALALTLRLRFFPLPLVPTPCGGAHHGGPGQGGHSLRVLRRQARTGPVHLWGGDAEGWGRSPWIAGLGGRRTWT